MGFFSKLFNRSDSGLEEVLKRGAVLIDVRTRQEFKDGHIHGALNIPLAQIPKQIKKIKLKKKPIIVYCRSGARAASATTFLKDAGIECYNGGGWVNLRKIVAKSKK